MEEYCRKLLQTGAKDGGFILTTSTTGYGETKPENIKAMIDSAEKYGRF